MSADHTKFQSPDDKPMPHSHSSNLDQQNVGSNSASQEQQQPLLFSYVELQNAEQMYREGKIAQEREQWNEAAELFSKSLEIRTKHYGLDYPGLAEHYHRYGRVLIEVAKQEGDPFGDAIKSKIKEQQQKQQQQQQQQQIADQRGHIESFDDGVKENTSQIVDINQSTSRSKESKDSREETKVPKEEIKFEEKNNNLTQKIEQKPTEVVDITSVVKIEDVNEENPLYPMASSETEKKSEESESAEEEDTTDEENNAHNENTEGEEQGEGEDNLEIAWEALEAARVLYVRQEEYLKLSDVHIDLGTVALESGNITAAIEEYEKSLKLRQQHLPNTDRRIAEAHFQMGLAYSLLPNNEKAREHYTAARDILQENVIILKKLSSHTNEHSIHNNSNQKTAENVIVPSVTFASSETSYVSKIGDSTEDEIQKKREEALKEMEEAIIELNDRIEEVSLPLLQQPNSTVSVPLPPGYDQFAQSIASAVLQQPVQNSNVSQATITSTLTSTTKPIASSSPQSVPTPSNVTPTTQEFSSASVSFSSPVFHPPVKKRIVPTLISTGSPQSQQQSHSQLQNQQLQQPQQPQQQQQQQQQHQHQHTVLEAYDRGTKRKINEVELPVPNGEPNDSHSSNATATPNALKKPKTEASLMTTICTSQKE